jgi:hypothetical protein
LSKVTRRNEKSRWNVVAFEQWLSVQEVIGVAIIKGDHDGPRRKRPIPERLRQLGKSHRTAMAAQNLQMLGKVLRCHTQTMRIRWPLSDAMIDQDEPCGREMISEAAHCPPKLSKPW